MWSAPFGRSSAGEALSGGPHSRPALSARGPCGVSGGLAARCARGRCRTRAVLVVGVRRGVASAGPGRGGVPPLLPLVAPRSRAARPLVCAVAPRPLGVPRLRRGRPALYYCGRSCGRAAAARCARCLSRRAASPLPDAARSAAIAWALTALSRRSACTPPRRWSVGCSDRCQIAAA